MLAVLPSVKEEDDEQTLGQKIIKESRERGEKMQKEFEYVPY